MVGCDTPGHLSTTEFCHGLGCAWVGVEVIASYMGKVQIFVHVQRDAQDAPGPRNQGIDAF